MKNILFLSAFALFSVTLLTTELQAKNCFQAKSIDVQWVSYKTMSKIGVGGNFSKTNLKLKQDNSQSLQSMLQGAKVILDLANIDAHLALKNQNIAKYFVSQLSTKKINAYIVSVNDTSINVSISLNNILQTIPMKYEIKDSQIKASGVIDALDFKLVPALNMLNKNVAGHKNKGWNDISLSFSIPYTNTCK